MFTENTLLHRRFAEVAAKYPDGFAIATEDGLLSLTYRELDERSTLLAKSLLKSAGDLLVVNSYVGVMTHRGIGMVVALLAVLKAGAAYVPVDPSFPKDRQAYIFSHSKCPLLIVDEGTYSEALTLASAAEAGASLPTLFAIEKDSGLPRDKTLLHSNLSSIELPTSSEIRPEAYVLYTSGSTGKPKGVMVYQDSVINIIDWFANDIGMSLHDRVLGLTTYCFDISVLEMFMPLTRGSGLVVTTAVTQKDPFRIVDVLKRMKISVMQATPTTFEMCLATGWKGDPNIHFLVGGEAFRPKLKEIVRNCKSMRNVYGPTETTIWSSSYLFDPDYIPEVIPIGKEISETQFYILNEKMEQVKDGEDGELFIGGLGVAKGYIHAPDLTAARFLPNPFGEGRIYRTGDQARKLPDGNYVFMNRLDDQVKINGYR